MTKARTKAQRRGRPRKPGAREPNGQPQRASVAEIRQANIEARMRQYGLSLAKAGERFAGYEIGRLYLRGQLDLVDVEVCDDYVQVVARFLAMTNPQHPFPRAMDYVARIKGIGGEPTPQQILRARKLYADWSEPLQACPAEARMAFHNVVFHDLPTERVLGQVAECVRALRRRFR